MTPITDKLADDWQHLRQYGYAPGNYMSRCRTCGDTPVMNKLAITCRPCAEERHAATLASQQAEPLCDCGKKPASQCDKWEEGCDLGQDPSYARVVMPKQAEPSDAMVEAAAKALLARRELKLEDLTNKAREHYLGDARAVLQAADAVSAGAPDGYVLVPEKATPLIREALRIGMRREVPNDDLCDIRWRAAIAAAQGSEQKDGNG